MNVCVGCGNEYEGTFCPECGLKCGPAIRCPACGTYVSGKYCSECGRLCADFAEDTSSEVTMAPSGGRGEVWTRGLDFKTADTDKKGLSGYLFGSVVNGIIDYDGTDIVI
ncbi:MAG: hypothetical protein LUD47_05905, partial [Clostridia bacterium]|nr:hypothetical protein [Clostridia bacterium]